MSRKCETCKHHSDLFASAEFEKTHCTQPRVVAAMGRCSMVQITPAREICNKEGDGIFVYFEPKDLDAGAFVQVTHEPALTAAVGGS